MGQARVKGWAGPWPVLDQWWTPGARRCAYLQVQVDRGDREQTVLLACEAGAWRVEGIYD
jgi:protein ImuB